MLYIFDLKCTFGDNAPCSMGLHLHQYLVFATSCISVFLVGILRSAFVCFQFCSFKAGIYQNIISKDRYTFSLSTLLAKIHTFSLSDRPSVYQNINSKDTPPVYGGGVLFPLVCGI